VCKALLIAGPGRTMNETSWHFVTAGETVPDEWETMAQESSIKSRSPVAAHPVTSAVIAVLTIAVIFFAVYVPLYARATPKVSDFPFLYF
jgi:hypothetical protein